MLSYLQQVRLPGSPGLWPTLSCTWEARGCYSNSWQQVVFPRQVRDGCISRGSSPNRLGLNRLDTVCRDRDIPISDLGSQWAVPFKGVKAQAAV